MQQKTKAKEYCRSLRRHAKEYRKDGLLLAVFADITRRVALPEEASIPTAEITTLKEILKK